MNKKLISDLHNSYLNIVFSVYAYIVGYFYMAPFYLIGLLIPPFKAKLSEFETKGTNSSILLISIISGTIFFITLNSFMPEFAVSILENILWLIGYIIFGYIALFILADMRLKNE